LKNTYRLSSFALDNVAFVYFEIEYCLIQLEEYLGELNSEFFRNFLINSTVVFLDGKEIAFEGQISWQPLQRTMQLNGFDVLGCFFFSRV